VSRKGANDLGFDLLSIEARERLDAFEPSEQRLFAEMLADARSEMQKELLQRALAAGHSAVELHAFSDQIRALGDEQVFAACTLVDAEEKFSVVQRLRAEADPIYGFLLNGHEISPRLDEDAAYPLPGVARRPQMKPPPGLMMPPEVIAPKPKSSFDAESSQARGKRLDLNDLGGSPDEPSGAHKAEPKPAGGREEFLNAAVRGLGLTFREQPVDGPELKLERALESASTALMRGVPVPIALGARVGDLKRYALILQVSTAGKSRAFQLHDPHSQETVWVNEGDLFARTELPFANKSLRRITAIALPVNRS
jgi:hypothetical protein